MRSDYYDGVSQQPLRPLPPKKKRRKKRGRLVLFFVTVSVLLLGSAAFALGMRGWTPPQTTPTPSALPSPQTAIPRLPPPGEGSLALVSGEAAALDPTEIYKRVSPSIVTVAAADAYGRGGEGTGVIFDARGYFVTNTHVIENTSMVQVTLSNGRVYPAQLIGMDAQTDLAVLRCSAPGLTVATFGSDADLEVGEPAYALGNPLGSQFSGSMTDGMISAINRNVVVGEYEMNLIQTTAALNKGNSGGALVDSRGYVIGITNMKMMSSRNTVEGLGFAIPATTVEHVVNELMTHGHVTGRPMLGIMVQPNQQEDGTWSGLLVVEVEEKSDAWAKGLRAGDVLLTANGAYLAENDDLLREKEGLQAGEGILLRWRSAESGEEQEAEILLVEQYELDEA